jgi:hypothetical protein
MNLLEIQRSHSGVRGQGPSAKVGGMPRKSASNRIIKAATFEGVMPGGQVSDELDRLPPPGGRRRGRHDHGGLPGRLPRGPHRPPLPAAQRGVTSRLRRLTDAVHAEGAAAAAQIGHAGPVANARSNGRPALARRAASPPWARACAPSTEAGIERITEDYRRAAARPWRPASTASRCTSATTTCSAPS